MSDNLPPSAPPPAAGDDDDDERRKRDARAERAERLLRDSGFVPLPDGSGWVPGKP